MKRLVLFTPGHFEAGGAASRSRLIASELAASGWQVKAITRAGTLGRFRLHRSAGLTLLEVPGFNRRRLGGALYLALAIPIGLVWGSRCKAMIAIQLMSTSTAAGICATLWRRPFLAFSTTSGTLSESAYIRGSRAFGLRRRLLRRAAWLVAQTEEVAEQLVDLTGSERVVVVPNPVKLPTPPPLDGRPAALFTGRFSEEKDLLGLLAAWEIVRSRNRDATLTLVGAGGEYRSVEPQVRAAIAANDELSRSVVLTGWVADVAPLLASADVFVLPSLEEGMSNALLEAGANGRVIVASDIAPNRAVLGEDHPLLSPAGNAERLAATILRAFDLDEEERRLMMEKLAVRMAAFSPEAIVRRLHELIDAADRTRN